MKALLRFLLYVVVVWAFLSYCSCEEDLFARQKTLPGTNSDVNQYPLNPANVPYRLIAHCEYTERHINSLTVTMRYPNRCCGLTIDIALYIRTAVHLPRDYL